MHASECLLSSENIFIVLHTFMASPGLKRGIIQRFIASFEEFLCTCRREESWVRGRVSSLQHSFCWSEACIYHDSPSI